MSTLHPPQFYRSFSLKKAWVCSLTFHGPVLLNVINWSQDGSDTYTSWIQGWLSPLFLKTLLFLYLFEMFPLSLEVSWGKTCFRCHSDSRSPPLMHSWNYTKDCQTLKDVFSSSSWVIIFKEKLRKVTSQGQGVCVNVCWSYQCPCRVRAAASE